MIQTKSKSIFFDRKLCNCKAKEKRSFQPTTLSSERKLDLTGFTSYGTHQRHQTFCRKHFKGMLTTVLSGKARECNLCLTRKFFLNKTAQYISLDCSFTYGFVPPTKNKQVEQLFCTYGFLCQRRLFCSRNSFLNKISPLL